jgi:DNA-binding Lrp family transcriptional regulator
MAELDHLDKRILELLQEDARITHKEISGKLGISTTPVFERVKKLERTGYIKKYVALVDPAQVGKSLVAFMSATLIRHTRTNIDKFTEAVKSLPEVMECYHITGSSDFLMKVVVKDMQAYHDFVTDKIATIHDIAKMQTSIVLSEIKHTTALTLSKDDAADVNGVPGRKS